MQVKQIEIPLKKSKLIVKIISFLDKAKVLEDKNKFLEIVCNELRNLKEKDHFGGFLDENGFRSHLETFLFDKQQTLKRYPSGKIEFKDVVKEVEWVIRKTHNILGKREIIIYILPTNSLFIIKKMGGVTGWPAWENIVHIYVYPTKNWRLNFKSTLLHELAHSMQDYYSYEMNLFDHLIADGLAEHFQEKFLNGKRNPFTKVVSKKKAKEIFKKVRPFMNKTMTDSDPDIHVELFFGSKKYPHWAGYTIGYYLVEDFLKNKKHISWEKLFRQKPQEFLKELEDWFK
ncbi:MAG: hypothetical protein IIA87_04355 [Nanoarchaeota archaeon]|nr:hypothetical protein [Nanoarchaeota archaeon]